jgi:hypothetical protein
MVGQALRRSRFNTPHVATSKLLDEKELYQECEIEMFVFENVGKSNNVNKSLFPTTIC